MRSVTTQEQADRLANWLVGLPLPYTVTVKEGRVRSLDQNSMLHRWYADIARQTGSTASEVKGQCHHEYGLPIRLRDPQFAWLWNNSAGKLDYERRCKVLASGQFQVSSKMTVAEFSEYMTAMQRDFEARGIQLTRPEE